MQLEVGMRIFVDVTSESASGGVLGTFALTSVVEEMPDNHTVIIQMPTHNNNYYSFSTFRTVYIRFPHKTSFFAFEARYQGSIERGLLRLARFERISGYEERQLRDCFRLRCFIPATVKPYWESEAAGHTKGDTTLRGADGVAFAQVKRIGEPEPVIDEGRPPVPGFLLDLSDGGALVAVDLDIERGSKLTLSFNLDFNVTVECVVVRANRSQNANFRFNYGCSFSGLKPKERERIYQFLVKEQQKKNKL